METQHVLKKSAIGFRVFAVDDYMGVINHNYLQNAGILIYFAGKTSDQ